MSGANDFVIDLSWMSPDEDDHCVKKPTTPFPEVTSEVIPEAVRYARFQRITYLTVAFKWIHSVPHHLDIDVKLLSDEQKEAMRKLWGRWFIPRNQLKKRSDFIALRLRVPDSTLDEVEQLIKRCFDAYDAVFQYMADEGIEHNLKPRTVRLEPLLPPWE